MRFFPSVWSEIKVVSGRVRVHLFYLMLHIVTLCCWNHTAPLGPCELSLKLTSHHYIRWAENFPVWGLNVYTKSPSWPLPFQLLSERSWSLPGQVSPPHPRLGGSHSPQTMGTKTKSVFCICTTERLMKKARKSRLSIAAARLNDKPCVGITTLCPLCTLWLRQLSW